MQFTEFLELCTGVPRFPVSGTRLGKRLKVQQYGENARFRGRCFDASLKTPSLDFPFAME